MANDELPARRGEVTNDGLSCCSEEKLLAGASTTKGRHGEECDCLSRSPMVNGEERVLRPTRSGKKKMANTAAELRIKGLLPS